MPVDHTLIITYNNVVYNVTRHLCAFLIYKTMFWCGTKEKNCNNNY